MPFTKNEQQIISLTLNKRRSINSFKSKECSTYPIRE